MFTLLGRHSFSKTVSIFPSAIATVLTPAAA